MLLLAKPLRPKQQEMPYNEKRLIPRGLRREDGAFAEIRTPDQLIKSQLLYQLSYEGLILGTG